MADSFQKEIPKARVNITLDVETGGARKKLELPMKLLCMGDFSNGKATGRVAERERIEINRNNLEQVMSQLAPEVHYSVPNVIRNDGSEVSVDLTFTDFKSFHPEQVAKQIPELDNLLAMRNLLKDLKSNLLDNSKFRKELEKIIKNQPELEELKSELEKIAPLQDENEPAAEAEPAS
ncbi:MAG TPA: type VI secretion system contractile sheath small subunit [Gammaproteobacteria bacterium]|nr:type VI secretion system contractile sheath small subunit [Gammaproteobacteria bacterium]